MPTSAASLVALVTVAVVSVAAHRHAPVDLLAAIVLALVMPHAVARAARRIGPPWFETAAPLVYAVLPVFGIAYSLAPYRHVFVHQAAPQLVGLRAPQDLALALLALLVVCFASARVLASLGVISAAVALAVWGAGFGDVHSGLHETGWSPTLALWVAVAGALGLALGRLLPAIGVSGWVAAVILRAADAGYGHHAEFWRALAPAAPEIALLLTAVALLAPPLRRAHRGSPAPAR